MKLADILLEIISAIKRIFCTVTYNMYNDKNSGDDTKNNHRVIITNSDNEIIEYSFKNNGPPSPKTSGFTETGTPKIMDGDEFRVRGKEVINYIVEYHNNVHKRSVTPSVKPGYLRPLLPAEAPMFPDKFEDVMNDFENKIMLGTVHWNHPNFYAYFPSGASYASLIGTMLCDMPGNNQFSWVSNPAGTELEIIVLDWFAKALDLPKKFLSTEKGGGVIMSSASDSIFVVMLAARHAAMEALSKERGLEGDRKTEVLPLLVAYCSRESHSCVEKAAKLCLVKLRILNVNEEGSVTGETLEKAMSDDEAAGLKPFFYSSILGSTAQAAFDNVAELGPICKKRQNMWLHVDGAYAGSAFICPEFRYLMAGLEHADSFNLNPHKWLLTHTGLAVLFVADPLKLTSGLIVDPIYLKHEYQESGIIDRRHMTISLTSRFRALKLWFVFRLYGISGLQEYIRKHIRLAKHFESLVKSDDRFEVLNNVRLGLVCFRLKGDNQLTEELLGTINKTQKLHMVPAKIKDDKFVIRFSVNYEHATEAHMDYAWTVIKEHATNILSLVPRQKPRKFTRQHSFTRSVSKEDFEKRSSSLYDGATPILVLQEDGEELNVFDEEFAKMTLKDG